VELRIPGLAPGLEGLRIAQISDVHVGPAIREHEVRTIVEAVNALSPDLVAITGDLVDGTVERIGPAVAPLAELRSTHGSFFCTGNHEYYSGVDAWCEEVARLGVRVLSETHVLVEHGGARLLVAGVDDPEGKRFGAHEPKPSAALEGAPPHDCSVLLAHRPRAVREASAAGFDLQLSGHTHGGQYFPYTWLVRLFEPFETGLHRVGRTLLYVNRGTTFWGPPIRLGSAQEITLLTLRRA
ncbi:MAG: metallophosphoesterase, partial [Polyangiaceae bacterium]|nr:metallophosphoesterase [Polyangiaceae bacterium]